MLQHFGEHISELLFRHECVIVPGFGAFIGNERSAWQDKFSKSFHPPTKKISFNRALTESDGLLAAFIADKQGLDHPAALLEIRKVVAHVNNKLLVEKSMVSIPEVGRFYVNSDEKIIFVAEFRKNFSMKAFGLAPVTYQPASFKAEELQEDLPLIKEETEVSKVVAVELEEATVVAPKEKKKRGYGWMLAAAAIVGLLLANQFVFKISPSDMNIQQFNLFDSITLFPSSGDPIIITDTESTSEEEVIADTNTDAASLEEVVEPIAEPVIPRPWESFEEITLLNDVGREQGFYVVIGSFSKKKYADRLQRKATNASYPTTQIPASNGMIRVALELPTEDAATVKEQLADIQASIEPGAWLVYNRL